MTGEEQIQTEAKATPDNIFLVNEQPGALRHFSTWQIKVFTKAIETLSHYTLDAVNDL